MQNQAGQKTQGLTWKYHGSTVYCLVMNIRKIVKKMLPTSLFSTIEPFGHLLEAVMWNTLYSFPARGMKVIGITGTNGKTSTAFLVHRMLQEAGYKTGLMSTVAYGAGDDIRPQIHHMTNVPLPEFMQRLKWMKSQNIDWLVLETTSHALAQHRVWGVPYSVAVLTNLTHEHLDYHKTFERYKAAKMELFKITARNTQGLQTGIVNADDPASPDFAACVPKAMTYGNGNGDLYATDIRSTPNGSEFTAVFSGRSIPISVALPGSFNVSNALAAAAVGIQLGLSDEQISKGIAALNGVEGRMTRIDEGQNFTAIVDFAHTPDSFEKLLKDLRPVVKGKLLVLFGSAGRRDETKRAIQGKLAGEYADEVIITEEDDRDIDGMDILEQIADGVEAAGKVRDKDLFLVHDRTEAIGFALGRAQPDDTVLLLGKGHEKTIERADGEHAWDEIGTVRNWLRAHKS
jgi:UDP-N-acetylmuramoyl-L-alanyl-D-glutamate--2,6-diaminopimelate ligase